MNTQYVVIETLTPLHIGSGRMLQGNTEYLYFSDTNTVALVDERKVLGIIKEENLDKWLQIIEREEDLLAYLKQRKPSITATDVARRTMQAEGRRKPSPQPDRNDSRKVKFPTIRERIFSGNGQAILPGSSLKGAIRTAIFNQLVRENPRPARQISDFKGTDFKGNPKYKGQKLESRYFSNVSNPGEGPNHDVFRLLRVGDAHFGETICLLSETLNEKGDQSLEMKESVKQLIECIPAGAQTLCRVQIPAELKARLSDSKYREVAGKIPHRDRMELPKLIADINDHTKRLIDKELDRYGSVHLPEGAIRYLEQLKQVTVGLAPNQCAIRVGFGTGYLSMTGGWAEEQWKQSLSKDKFEQEMDGLATAVRRNARYNSFALPKSRKMALGGVPLGFLKLTVLTEDEAHQWQAKAADREVERLQKAEAQRIANEEAARLAAEAEAQRQEEARIAAEEARKPKLFTGTMKQGQELDAEIVASGRTNKVKVYAAGYENKVFDLIGYIGPETVGKVVIVKADQVNSKKVLLQVRYQKFK